MNSEATSNRPDPRIVKNTILNFLGMTLPIGAAVACIPQLIEQLGTPRFGVLTLVWLVIGYFGQFNFGLGRATAKFAAQELAVDGGRRLPELVRSSMLVHLGLGLIAAGCLAMLVPPLVGKVLAVPPEYRREAAGVLYLLVPTIPMILLSDCLRGVLEAHQRFGVIASVQAPTTTMTYVGPLLVLPWSDGLVAVIAPTLGVRLVALVAYGIVCARLVPGIATKRTLAWDIIRPMLGFGGWATVSALAAPILAAIDRFTIGAVVSLSAVAWYAAPFEIVSKLCILSGSLLAVLFPIFTALARTDRTSLPPLYYRSVKLLTAVVVPSALLLFVIGPELLRLWLGEAFAAHGTAVVRLLAIGIAVTVVAQVPFTLLQSADQARIPALFQLIQLPCYATVIWWSAANHGIAGVAMTWTLRSVIEAVALFVAADRLLLRSPAVASRIPAASSLPLVSIVVPAYNHAAYLHEAIDGILNQDYPHIEMIVLNDGSTDATEDLLRSYSGGRFYWETQANLGQAATLNKGWRMARGEILAYLSADDVLHPSAVRRSVEELLRHPAAVATYCDFELITADSQVVRRVFAPAFSYRDMVERFVCHPGPGAFFRRSAFEQAGPWNVAYRQMPDYDFWLRLGLLGPFHHIRESLASFRVHDASQTYAPATPAKCDEPLRIIAEYYRRDDLPHAVRNGERRARSYAHLTAADLHWRAGRYGFGVSHAARAVMLHPLSAVSPHTGGVVAHALFSRARFSLARRIYAALFT